jgi:hypothetical protein
MRQAVLFVLGCGYGLIGLFVIPAGLFNAAVAVKIWAEAPGHWSIGLPAVAFLAVGEMLVAATCLLIAAGLLAQKRWATYLTAGFNLAVLTLWLSTLPWWALERDVYPSSLWGLVPFAALVGVTVLLLSKPMRQFTVP